MRTLWESSGCGSAAVRPRRGRQQAGTSEFLDAPTCLSFETVPIVTGPGEPSWLSVVVGAGRVHTTTSRRARR
jgi:hypothetical protein